MEPSKGTVAAGDLTQIVQILRRAIYGDASVRGDAQVVVEGTDDTGWMTVAVSGAGKVYRLRVPDHSALLALAGPQLKPRREVASPTRKYETRTGPQFAGHEQAVVRGQSTTIFLAGPQAQMGETIYSLSGGMMGVAAFTSRGPTAAAQGVEYKSFNEDAVVGHLWMDPSGSMEVGAIGAFDQAGGEGAVANANGAASDAAARSFVEAVQKIETGVEPFQAFTDAISGAERSVRSFNVGAMTTFAAAVIIRRILDGGVVERQAFVAVVGDSRVLWVDRFGNVKARTILHNMGAAIAAGQVADIPPPMALQFASALTRSIGSDEHSADMYRWNLEAGDRLIVETDGIGDAREIEEMPPGTWHADLCADEQGKLIAKTNSPTEAVSTLVGYALDQMADRYGKPDNVAVAVLQVT